MVMILASTTPTVIARDRIGWSVTFIFNHPSQVLQVCQKNVPVRPLGFEARNCIIEPGPQDICLTPCR
jgi:hypothetical protein